MPKQDSIETFTRGRPVVTDLADRTDVEALLRRFYGRVFVDDALAEPFGELRETGLESHLPVMCDFWETALFRAGVYHRNALAVHRQLSDRHPLTPNHFDRWPALWIATVDEMYHGPVAEHAKIQATRIATSISRRLSGDRETEATRTTMPGEVTDSGRHPVAIRGALEQCCNRATLESPNSVGLSGTGVIVDR